jgi:hypothetical protein
MFYRNTIFSHAIRTVYISYKNYRVKIIIELERLSGSQHYAVKSSKKDPADEATHNYY